MKKLAQAKHLRMQRLDDVTAWRCTVCKGVDTNARRHGSYVCPWCGEGVMQKQDDEVPVTQMCSDIACADDAIARVEVVGENGPLREVIVCERHLARIEAAHAERPTDYPPLQLLITRLT